MKKRCNDPAFHMRCCSLDAFPFRDSEHDTIFLKDSEELWQKYLLSIFVIAPGNQ